MLYLAQKEKKRKEEEDKIIKQKGFQKIPVNGIDNFDGIVNDF